jgi:hypothetical protein
MLRCGRRRRRSDVVYPRAAWQATPDRDAYVLHCPHCGKPLIVRQHGHEETGIFVTFAYADRYHDGYYRKADHRRQRRGEKMRRVQRLRAGVVRTGFVIEGDKVHQKVFLPSVRRIECGFCSQRADVPPYEHFAPTLPGLDVWRM